jgi:hypothetical protein
MGLMMKPSNDVDIISHPRLLVPVLLGWCCKLSILSLSDGASNMTCMNDVYLATAADTRQLCFKCQLLHHCVNASLLFYYRHLTTGPVTDVISNSFPLVNNFKIHYYCILCSPAGRRG